nr:C40 family peptidase [Gammaproteobacteria bacterium]
FEISVNEWQACEAVVHSHPCNTPFLSGADRQQQQVTRCDWWLVVNNEIIKYPFIPLLKGREFNYGVADCCSIIVDSYRLANIKLTDGQRLGIDKDIEQQTIIKCFENTGFYQVDINKLQVGDVILTRYENNHNKASHAGLYLGDEQVLHHEINKLSQVTSLHNFTGNDLDNIHSVWRHNEWQDNSITAIKNDLNAS